jgi:hypothetical protein
MRIAFLAALAGVVVSAGAASATTYTYVGDWAVGQASAPVWTSDPPVYSGQQAAALLFGGVASDYVISTVDSNPADINFMAHVDGWGDPTYLTSTVSESYSLSTNGPGYNDDYGVFGSAYSAYVYDHSCAVGGPYCAGGGGESAFNYAFVVSSTPLPSTWTMLIAGFVGLFGFVAFGGKKRNAAATAAA